MPYPALHLYPSEGLYPEGVGAATPFPEGPREISVEMYLGGDWEDVSADVYGRDGITITRGRSNEAGGVDPASCSLTLDNRSGDYSPRNPAGAYYGQLGRNTPIRIGITRARDSFSRSETNGWGDADMGGAWTSVGTASDFAVADGVGTMLVSVANTLRATYLADTSYRDADVAATVAIPDSDVTGGSLLAGLYLRRNAGATAGYLVYASVTTAEAVTVSVYDLAAAAVIVGPTTVSGLTHSSSQSLRIRAQADGQTIRGKVWASTDAEPFDWTVEVHDDTTTTGYVGIYSAAASGNTDVPITFSWAALTVLSMRFHGEVSTWPARTDVTGEDAVVELQAGGLRRRLAQGGSALQSALRRSTPELASLVAYWPMEDRRGATELASAVDGQPPMYRSGPVKFGENSDFVASEPLPVLNGGILFARPASYTTTNYTQVRCLYSVPSSGGTNGTALLWILTTGTAGQWMITYGTGGSMALKAFNFSGSTAILDTGAYAFRVDGRPCRIGMELTQNGADIDYRLAFIAAETGSATYVVGTLAGYTVGRVTQVQLNMDAANESCAAGHVTVQTAITSQSDQAEELTGYATGAEQAGDRIQRLCSENSIPFAYIGSLSVTDMGPQPIAPLLEALDDAADADAGTLVESRSAHALVFRERRTLFNASPVATLTYTAGELAPPFEPVDDDSEIRNDVTFKRSDGSQARVEQATGPLNTADPADGGVGRYAVQITGNTLKDSENASHAGWHKHLGTVDEPRFPRININLANANVANHATLPDELLDLDVDDRIAVDSASSIGFYDLIEQRVLGYTEQLNAYEHRLSLNCAPAVAWDIPVTDASTAKVDTTTATLTSNITSAATSVSVTTTGAIWTTTAGQMPIPIRIGGEEMSVTAISGSSSPQTFTVTRAVNGVAKAHSAGASVRLRDRPVVAL